MKWPFMLKSTHEREMVRLTQDFARNTATLEAALRARGGMGAPPPVLSRMQLFTVDRLVQLLASGALQQAEANRPVFQMIALHAEPPSQNGALLAVLAGKLGPADMRRFRTFVCGLAQDAAPSERLATYCDNLGQEDPSND
jgi:hypothetical protein